MLAIVLARMSSKRLPGKVLMEFLGKPLLLNVVERVLDADGIDEVVVSTSLDPADDAIAEFCSKNSVKFYRGSQHNVLNRFVETANAFSAKSAVRICGDSPLTHPSLITEMVKYYESGDFDIVTNTFDRSFPKGFSVEVVNIESLQGIDADFLSSEHKEHVTSFFYNNPNKFKILNVENEKNMSGFQLSVDTPFDFGLLQRSFKKKEIQTSSPNEIMSKLKDQTDSLRVGVVGLGVGEQHIDALNAIEFCEVVGVADFDASKIHSAAQRQRFKQVFATAEDLITSPEIDAVSIASFDEFHAQHILLAVENDKHVFVEKPVCVNPIELKKIHDALQKKPWLQFCSNLVLRKSPRLINVQKSILEGHFGQIYYFEGDYDYGRLNKLTNGWRGENEQYSVMLGGGVHVIDIMLWFMKKRPTHACALAGSICSIGSSFKGNDLTVTLLKFADKSIAKISANFGSCTPHHHRFNVYGTKGTFWQNHDGASTSTGRGSDCVSVELVDDYPNVHKGALIHDFVKKIFGYSTEQPFSDDVFDALSICFAIEKSLRSGKFEKVDYLKS